MCVHLTQRPIMQMVVTVGVAIASFGEINFVAVGVMLQLISVASESVRLSLVQILLQASLAPLPKFSENSKSGDSGNHLPQASLQCVNCSPTADSWCMPTLLAEAGAIAEPHHHPVLHCAGLLCIPRHSLVLHRSAAPAERQPGATPLLRFFPSLLPVQMVVRPSMQALWL